MFMSWSILSILEIIVKINKLRCRRGVAPALELISHLVPRNLTLFTDKTHICFEAELQSRKNLCRYKKQLGFFASLFHTELIFRRI